MQTLNTSKAIKTLSKIIYQKYDNSIPNNINELVKLPGVGRKTANVVLGTYFNIPSIVVDTHVIRIVNLLQFCRTTDPGKIEKELTSLIDKQHWVKFTHLIRLQVITCTDEAFKAETNYQHIK